MHADEEALLQTVFDHPDDDAPRLVYADWLEETGAPANVARAEFIRVQCALERPGLDAERAEELHGREEELLHGFEHLWPKPVAARWLFWDYRRGFVHRFRHRGVFRRGTVPGEQFLVQSNYLRFFSDGTVISLWTREGPRQAAMRLRYGASSLRRGQYELAPSATTIAIQFTLSDRSPIVDFNGTFDGHALLLDTNSRAIGQRARVRYHWVDVPVPDAEEGEDRAR